MTYLEYKEKFDKALIKNNLQQLNDNVLEKLFESQNMILEKNKNMNLTAICTDEEFIYRHWIDILKTSKYIDDGCKIIDVGTGSGVVAICLALLNENSFVDALDSTSKKVEFIEDLKSKIDIKNLKPICARAEDYAKTNREKYDVCIARAVSDLQVLNELCIPFVKINGKFIAMKGKNAKEELQRSLNGAKTLGCVEVIDDDFDLFECDSCSKRHILVFKKKTKTDLMYPRNYSQIVKKPL